MLQTYMKDLGLKEKYHEYLHFSYCYAINYDFEDATLTHVCTIFPIFKLVRLHYTLSKDDPPVRV